MFVTAWIDLGPEHTEKTPASRLEHFKRLASSGITLFVFVSASNVAVMEEVQTEFPNIVGLRSVEVDDLQSVQTIRSFIDLRLPTSLNDNKDTHGFLELMLAKIDFVYQALAYTDATHLAWIDFNIAHVFDDSVKALEALQDLQQRDLGGLRGEFLPLHLMRASVDPSERTRGRRRKRRKVSDKKEEEPLF